VVLFMSSGRASFITGNNMRVDSDGLTPSAT
jgi:hypothetical protein